VESLDRDRASESVRAAFSSHAEMVRALGAMGPDIIAAADVVASAFADGHQLLLCGNGGSAADAQHIAAEFTGRFLKERNPWPAIALSTNSSGLTAIGNDYGFENVFSRQVRAHGHAGDVLLAISTSGSSPNILAAIESARELGMQTVGLSGAGGDMSRVCDICLAVPSDSTPRVQEGHILVAHVLCGLVEDALTQ